MSATNRTYYSISLITEGISFYYGDIPLLFSRKRVNDLLNTLCNPVFKEHEYRKYILKELNFPNALYSIEEFDIVKFKKSQLNKKIAQLGHTIKCNSCKAKNGERILAMEHPIILRDYIDYRTQETRPIRVYDTSQAKIEVDRTNWYIYLPCSCIHRNKYYDYNSLFQKSLFGIFTYDNIFCYRTSYSGYITYV